MPLFWIEEAGTVEEEDGQHGDNSQPIDVVSTFLHDFSSFQIGKFQVFLDDPAIATNDQRMESAARCYRREASGNNVNDEQCRIIGICSIIFLCAGHGTLS